MAEVRDGQRTLLVKTTRGDVVLADALDRYLLVAPDCIVFSPFDDGRYYIECSDRRPMRIQTEPLQGRAEMTVIDGKVRLVDEAPDSRVQLEVDPMLARRKSHRAPEIRTGWRSDPQLEVIKTEILGGWSEGGIKK